MLYDLWTTEELLVAIKGLTQQMSDGLFSASYTGGGFTQNVSIADAERVANLMMDELQTRAGYDYLKAKREKKISTGARSIRIRMKD